MEQNGTEKNEKNEYKFVCKKCDFKCFYKSDWTRHIRTDKHNLSVSWNKNGTEERKNEEKNETNYCNCGRSYSSKTNLNKHKKTCKIVYNGIFEEKMNINDLVKYLMKENIELKNMLLNQSSKISDITIELAKNSSNNTTNNTTTHTNSHNKAFNLNFFLNETCKNAMNINDFIDSIKLQLTDLISVGELGYVDGISNIIVKNLNALDETERPIHCTDKKRETIYIKHENQWEKDDDKRKLKKMIKSVAYKNQNMFPKFKEKYPDYNDYNSIHSDQYSKIVVESLYDDDKDKEDKIIRKITKQVLINK